MVCLITYFFKNVHGIYNTILSVSKSHLKESYIMTCYLVACTFFLNCLPYTSPGYAAFGQSTMVEGKGVGHLTNIYLT